MLKNWDYNNFYVWLIALIFIERLTFFQKNKANKIHEYTQQIRYISRNGQFV